MQVSDGVHEISGVDAYYALKKLEDLRAGARASALMSPTLLRNMSKVQGLSIHADFCKPVAISYYKKSVLWIPATSFLANDDTASMQVSEI